MSTLTFVSRLRDLDVRLWLQDGRLRYSAPEGVMTPQLRAELVARKEEVIAFLREVEGVAGPGAPPILPVSRDRPLPLSYAQQRLWFLDQWEPGSHTYNILAAWRLSGRLDSAALAWSLNEIVRRHAVLRTTCGAVDGQPVQVIAPALSVPLPVVDLQPLPEPEREAQARRLIGQEVRRPFDLARGPLLRATLLRLGELAHIFVLSVHHIAFDGWSTGVFVRELVALYRASWGRAPAPLPELPIQYADYAVWQRDWLQGEVLEAQLDYWKRRLGGDLNALELPTDRPRPPAQTYRGARHPFRLSRSHSDALKELSQREGVTLFMTLLAAFKALLHRYTGQTDIVVGSPIANRNRSEIEDLIGFFVNTLVLRSDLSGDLTFREALGRVREVTLGAYAHQDLPFERLVDELQPGRDLSRSPLFQVMFILQNAPAPPIELPGLTLSVEDVDPGSAKFDLTLVLQEAEGGLEGLVEYNTDLFDAGTIARFGDHFRTLLQGVVADPEQRLADLPLLTDAEQSQLLLGWNETALDYPQDRCLHELFEAQVARTPDARAVVAVSPQGATRALTYRELNARANRLAHHLLDLGVGPDVLVGVCIERTLEMVVGLLGVLKAGGAYLPLDPAFPRERLAFMLADTQAPVLLTQRRLLDTLPAHSAQVLCLDADWGAVAGQPRTNPRVAVSPANLAYTIYTSGSTGKPKGVAIFHRAVVNFLNAMRRRPGLGPEDVLLSVTTLSFDISVLELFLPLITGAQVALVSAEVAGDGPRLTQTLAAVRPTVMQATPATWQMLLAAGWGGDERLRVLCGGEALPVSLAEPLLARSAGLWNLYGPTETTVWSCVYPVVGGQGLVPIGRPIGNTRIYLLDAQMQPVPVGVAGELYIGGDGLARGYLKRPGLTAAKFVPDPFGDGPGARLYRTGDLARYRADGNVEFLGRMDHQVKVRGFRIELGEIESVFEGHPGVRQAVVMPRRGGRGDGDKLLVGYFVPQDGTPPPARELRHFLADKLPAYMVPTLFTALDGFPLTANGKVNRRALPAPEFGAPERESTFVAPGTPFEEILAQVWGEVLGMEKIGVQANFFDLGGHSLLATQVASRVRDRFEIELPVRTIFEAPTVATLALRVEQALVAKIDALDEVQVSRLLAD